MKFQVAPAWSGSGLVRLEEMLLLSHALNFDFRVCHTPLTPLKRDAPKRVERDV
jgi:hypothetical protein